MNNMLLGKRVLVTQATEFMGATICDVFSEQGADVIRSEQALVSPEAIDELFRNAGDLDVLVANLSILAPSTAAAQVDDAEWQSVFAALVNPLPGLIRTAVPLMTKRGASQPKVSGETGA
jgi:2-keto-3-deoxy-L-fuconate dehydrogenase